jgi:hypothetical protein
MKVKILAVVFATIALVAIGTADAQPVNYFYETLIVGNGNIRVATDDAIVPRRNGPGAFLGTSLDFADRSQQLRSRLFSFVSV